MSDEKHPIMESDQQPDGDMGVSSERVGPVGHGEVGTTGVRDTEALDPDELGDDVPPEQRPGAVEENPEGIPPKAAPAGGHDRTD